MRAGWFAVVLVVCSCGGEKAQPASSPSALPTSETTSASTTAPTASATASTPGVDLSTEEKARAAMLDALQRDDKEAFKKCVSQRILTAHAKDFDSWYAVWKSAATKTPNAFKTVTVSKEGAEYKLDEN